MTTNHYYDRDVVSIRDFSRDELEFLFSFTDKISTLSRSERSELGRGRTLGSIYYEPSTRTRMSFEAAISSIGGSSIGIADPKSSSIEKGESLSDTIRIMDLYCDVLALRHPLDGSGRFASELSSNPVINAGSGSEEHPTQAMLDALIIKQEFGRLQGLRIALVGDLDCGRAARTLALFFATHYPKNEVVGVSPKELRMRSDVKQALTAAKVPYREVDKLEDVVGWADIVYMTRLQKEHERKGLWSVPYPRLTLELAHKIDKHARIMHPLPANRDGMHSELPYEIDDLPQSVYFKQQLQAGPRIRKAILQELLL